MTGRQHYASQVFWSDPQPPQQKIYPLSPRSQPDHRDTDSHGNLLVFSPTHGWMVISIDELPEALLENHCTYWTYTPPEPTNAHNHPRRTIQRQTQR